MASIIPGYNYDIFISYRQKDNKGERWVSHFVEALKTELESTFKEDVSVYFDENPHDRLQETHDVNKSLEGKLKCLIFIPVISQTYCDPISYAWNSEFIPFLRIAEKDRFGKDVKLRSGNVANRILPIRIHDLEQEDINLYENEAGSVLRAIDFVFKTGMGVNRPLLPEDNKNDNLNKTLYRDQINKVARAIKEIILGMKAEPVKIAGEIDQLKKYTQEVRKEEIKEIKGQSTKAVRIKFLIPLAVAVVLIVAGIITYPRLFKRDTLERLRSSGERISVAVMPFRNMTNDTTWNIWQDGIQNELITYLTNSKELRVRQFESINSLIQDKGYTNYASITPSVARHISQKLDTKVFIYGSLKQVGKMIRLNAQLINSRTEEVYKSFQIDGTEEKILNIADSLSTMISDFLIISVMEKEIIRDFRPLISTNYPEAYNYYRFGNEAFYKYDFQTATEWYLKAIDIDSTFFEAARMLIYSLGHQGLPEESQKLAQWYYEKKDQMSEMERFWAEIIHAKTPDEKIKFFRLLIALDDEMPVPYHNLAGVYVSLKQYDIAISLYEKELEIYENWNVKPRWPNGYVNLGKLYHLTGEYKKERKIYRKAEKDFPEDLGLILNQVSLALALGKTNDANKYIGKYLSISRNKGIPEEAIFANLALRGSQEGVPDMVKDFCHRLLLLQSLNLTTLNPLAKSLLDSGRNLEEALELAERALMLNPDDYTALHRKGWALYKLGRYKEALEVMQKSQDIRLEKNVNDEVFSLHLDSVKMAVAEPKNN